MTFAGGSELRVVVTAVTCGRELTSHMTRVKLTYRYHRVHLVWLIRPSELAGHLLPVRIFNFKIRRLN
jgi:hypothetical protein